MSETRAAATLILIDDSEGELVVLMTRRDRGMELMGGFWVFPGGSVEPDDGEIGMLDTARTAAARETKEEVGLSVVAEELIDWAHWEPPTELKKRFATWFFVGRAPGGDVLLDGREARDHAWWRPADVLAARDRGEVELGPPTWVTLYQLSAFRTVDDVLTFARTTESEFFVTKMKAAGDEWIALWKGDVAYERDDAHVDEAGARHRLWMLESGWSYERG